MKINGKEFLLEQTNKTLAQLLQELGIDPRTVAVELNGNILNRNEWETTFLQNSDKIEIIKFVGGG